MSQYKKIFRFLYFIPLVGYLSGCTSTPKATEYPQRYIDQPYTLPDKVDSWGSAGAVFYERSKGQNYTWQYPIPIPLFWEHSINENLTLEIPILPIGLRWKISSDEMSELGMHLSWGFGYGSSSGMNFFPSINLFYKKRLDKDKALIVLPGLGYSYYARDTNKNYFNASLSLGYLIQLNDLNAIQARIIFSYSEYNKKMFVPLEIFYTYRMSQTWQFESSYKYSGVGYDDYFGHFFTFIFKKYF